MKVYFDRDIKTATDEYKGRYFEHNISLPVLRKLFMFVDVEQMKNKGLSVAAMATELNKPDNYNSPIITELIKQKKKEI